MAGRIQLVKTTIIAIAQFWMHCLPLLKSVIKKIDSICRSFVWTGKATVSKKSPIAWNSVCRPKSLGGMNIFNLCLWNDIALLKCLWNLSLKADNLWVKWVHAHYLKKKTLMEADISNSCSWVIKKIFKLREHLPNLQPMWDQMIQKMSFCMHKLCDKLMDFDRVPWRYLLQGNSARPRATIITWMACHGRLSTKDRLRRIGLITDHICSLCNVCDKTLDHLLFECRFAKDVWKYVLQWIGISHEPQPWSLELGWITRMTTKKGWRFRILKIAIAETIYGVWQYRNDVIFRGNTHRNTSIDIGDRIIEKLMYRGWYSPKLKKHIATLML
ncbi:uncharacterized protein LOC131642556 [Vicia villosa]|uniref:uncharacterized protein LOC131642556 n=1 Tax=Vicia villosa TaxID=3911 RepID=UPI00273B267B|nr:uncharacterized protein LOC131642556 [Vicia villosa]